MEEPETAIPPYAQKRIVQEVRALASQTLFTSHSPYVLEEFTLAETVVLSRDANGRLTQSDVTLPDSVKLKRYRQEFRTRFCEGLLATRILVAEGATEASALPAAARRLAELDPDQYVSLEAMGICAVDAGGEGNIVDMAALYRALGKQVFAVCDKQSQDNERAIRAEVADLFMHNESSLEKLVLKESAETALVRFVDVMTWPPHILAEHRDPKRECAEALRKYFAWSKGAWGIADFLAQCAADEMPKWITDTCAALRALCDPPPERGTDEPTDDDDPIEESPKDDDSN